MCWYAHAGMEASPSIGGPRAAQVWRLLRDARRDAGLTQQQVADRAGTSQAAVARYEHARAMPDLDTLYRLLLVCGRRLELTTTPVDDDVRQIDESLALTSAQRVERNQRVHELAYRAATAQRRPLRAR